jgi:tetratricopeptide (TPR) repeat protein
MKSTLDDRIASLTPEVDDAVRADLLGALRTLRDAANVPGALVTLSRMLEGNAGLLGLIAERVPCKLKGHSLDAQIEQLAQAGVVPTEIASDLHWIRVRATRARHNIERVALETEDAEFALSRALTALRWFYCIWERGPRLPSLVRSGDASPPTGIAESPSATAGPIPWTLAKRFTGRIDQRARLRAALENDETSLIVVQGRGGIGKTALVVALLDELRKAGAVSGVRGTIYLNLAQPEQRTPDKLVRLLREIAGEAASASLARIWEDRASVDLRLDRLFHEHLQHEPVLIVLDGLEAILDGFNGVAESYADFALFFAKLLQYEHRAKVVATSRRALFLAADMEGAAGMRRTDVVLDDGLADDEAVALLRTLDFDGALRLRAAAAEQLRRVVRMCHGMPRLLERVVGTLRQRPTWSLERLATSPEGLPRIAQDPARELFESLPPEDRLVLQSLAVFERPMPAAAIRFMLPDVDVESVLDRFVRDFVVDYDYECFSLSSLDRDYAYRSLPEGASDGEAAANTFGRRGMHLRSAEYFQASAKPPVECIEVNDIDPHLERYRHYFAAGEITQAFEVCRAISTRLDSWGHSSTLLQIRLKLVGLLKDPSLEAQNLAYLGWVYTTQDDAPKAVECLQRAVALAETAGDLRAHASALNSLGIAIWQSQGAAEAAPIFRQAMELAQRGGHDFEEARGFGNHGLALAESGESDRAIEEYRRAEVIYRKLGRTQSVGIQLGNIGLEHFRSGRFPEARECSERALAIAQTHQARDNEASWTAQLASIDAAEGREAESVAGYEAAARIAEETGSIGRRSDILCDLGLLQIARDEIPAAIACRDRISLDARSGSARSIEVARRFLASQIDFAAGEFEAALAECCAAIDLERRRMSRHGEVRAHVALARLLHAAGRTDKARQVGQAALDDAQRFGYRPLECDAALVLGAVLCSAGDVEQARSHFESAFAIAASIGSPRRCAAAKFARDE